MKGESYLRFGKIAPFYDAGLKVLGLAMGGEGAVRTRVLDLLPLAPGERVLEIGCGTGTMTLLAAQRVGATGGATGIDPSPEMLAQARNKLQRSRFPQVTFLHGGGAPLPFGDSSFEAVICFLVLHEMEHEDRIESLREALRVLKPGGHLLVGELNRPESYPALVLLRLLLLIEEEEAADFLSRGLPAIIAEGCGTGLREVERVALALGLGQGVLYRKE